MPAPLPPDDAIVVGAGPAGATAARLLATWGHRVTLLTRAPTRPEFAESLPPSGVHLLARVGIWARIDRAGFIRATGNTVWWGDEPERVESFPAGTFGLQVQRAAFDRLLVAEAREAGTSVVEGASAREVSGPDASGVSDVRFELAGTPLVRGAAWVLDGTGRGRLLARSDASWDASARTMAVAGLWHHTGEWPLPDWTHTTVESGKEGWAWSIPRSPSMRYVTVMLDPALTTVRGGEHLREGYQRALATFRRHSAMTRGATLAEPPFAVDATPYQVEQVATTGRLSLGDAASFVDPLASFGLKKALASGWLGAVVVHTALTTPAMTAAALSFYRNWEDESRHELRRVVGEFARRAGGHPSDSSASSDLSIASEFWRARSFEDEVPQRCYLDAQALRDDPAVIQALAALRGREELTLRMNPSCARVPTAVVKDNLIVYEDHVATPSLATAVRYVRNVDLLRLAELAVQHHRVPDIMDDYIRLHGAMPLADLLGAIAVLVAKGVLEIA